MKALSVLLVCYFLLLNSGCGEPQLEPLNSANESSAMPSASTRWSTRDQIAGLRVLEYSDMDDGKRAACRRRGLDPDLDAQDMSEAEKERYDKLNLSLHKKMEAWAERHFHDTPVPEILQKAGLEGISVTPFTYQNWDWYGPSYECYIIVWEDEVSSQTLVELQALLTGEHKDWSIVVCTTQDPHFDPDYYDIAIFSDEALIPEEALKGLQFER